MRRMPGEEAVARREPGPAARARSRRNAANVAMRAGNGTFGRTYFISMSYLRDGRGRRRAGARPWIADLRGSDAAPVQRAGRLAGGEAPAPGALRGRVFLVLEMTGALRRTRCRGNPLQGDCPWARDTTSREARPPTGTRRAARPWRRTTCCPVRGQSCCSGSAGWASTSRRSCLPDFAASRTASMTVPAREYGTSELPGTGRVGAGQVQVHREPRHAEGLQEPRHPRTTCAAFTAVTVVLVCTEIPARWRQRMPARVAAKEPGRAVSRSWVSASGLSTLTCAVRRPALKRLCARRGLGEDAVRDEVDLQPAAAGRTGSSPPGRRGAAALRR